MANIAGNHQYIPKSNTRVKSDASREGLGFILEQQTQIGRKTLSYASCFLNQYQQK